jgi:c-di-GMP-binding flagellar brake protein YcgR
MAIERRQFPRVTLICKMTLTCGQKSLVYSSHTENVSVGGMRLILEEKLPVRRELEVELFLPDRQKSIKCKGQTIWVREVSPPGVNPRFFDTGIEFMDMSDASKGILTEAINTFLIQIPRFTV